MDVNSHEDLADNLCSAEFIFSMRLLGFVTKAIKL